MNIATKLNPVQNHLLTLFDKGMGDQELNEIKQLLIQYYQERIENEVDAFWKRKQFTTASFDEATNNLHLRISNQEE